MLEMTLGKFGRDELKKIKLLDNNMTFAIRTSNNTNLVLKCKVSDVSYMHPVNNSRALFYNITLIHYPKKWRGKTITDLSEELGLSRRFVHLIGKWK
jgi:hypothetical protein